MSEAEFVRDEVPSQLSPHGGRRTELPGRYGPIAALSGPAPAEAAATVLLVPGYTGSKEDFAPLLDGLAGAGLHPVAVDLPGQYESPGPDDESRYLPLELGEVVAELAGTLAADGRPVLLLGHSYGGLVARGAVLAGAPVAGLTLLNSGPAKLPPGFRLQALDAGEPLLRQRGVEAAYAVREQVSAASPAWGLLAAELRAFLRKRFVTSSAAGLLGMALGLRAEPDRVAELAERLRDRAVPGLVVAGERDDAWTVPVQQEMARRLGAPFAVVADAAHSPNTENPDGLLDVLLSAWRTWLA
ncbi:alpha/beta fold hydrolase [Prauserella muralis]|uniref:Alpha/beta hydrolase n=1 Tax=Prauserella muralis TaxID=588067 RepID=A0A2V4BB19_9PSEU|nr:alpha/beta hydrolase [Prauserella muralis]PXY32450.1 alpha/beta hydrolase [Prauserella muralis]TWE23852.1 alpha-beta hydrolase superfamily lysophospholipase [Prauserella muralis]